jgi:class 3 adenylate cyclase
VAGSLKPETRYARSGDVNIAYQVFGEGERHLVLVPGWVSNVEVFWEDPVMARFLERLASATILFTDIVEATRKATELGDRRWRDVLDAHHAVVRTELGRFRGREIDTAGDGFLAAFDGPARGVRAACAVADSVRQLGLDVRAGLHTGECEVMGAKLGGIAVHIGARIAALAKAGEVLVSSTVKDLVAGSGLAFVERGPHALKGVPGEWRLYAVDRGTSGV